MPKQVDPAVVFDRLFAGFDPAATREQVERRLRQNKSLLDFMLEDASALDTRLGTRRRKKLADDAFTKLLGSELADRGYAAGLHGQAQWNGVAILSRVGLDDVTTGIDYLAVRPDPNHVLPAGYVHPAIKK